MRYASNQYERNHHEGRQEVAVARRFGLILGILIVAGAWYGLHSGQLNKQAIKDNRNHQPARRNLLNDDGLGGKSDRFVQKNKATPAHGRFRQEGAGQKPQTPFTPREDSLIHENENDRTGNRSLPLALDTETVFMENSDNQDLFEKRLQEIEEEGITEEENEIADPIFFSTSMPDMQLGLQHRPESFSPYSTRIFACFASTTENLRDQREVLVKWHKENREILLFQSFSIVTNANFNYIWKEMDYWDVGIYNVEIFNLEDKVKLLASGSYIVENLDEFVGYIGTYPTPEQVAPQSVFYGDDEIYLVFKHSNQMVRYLQVFIDRIESSEEILKKEIELPALQNGLFQLRIKQSGDVLPAGSYLIRLLDDEFPVGQSRFYIDEF